MTRRDRELALEVVLRLVEFSLGAIAVADQVIDLGNVCIQSGGALKCLGGKGVVICSELRVAKAQEIERLMGIKLRRPSVTRGRGLPISDLEVFATNHVVILRLIWGALDRVLEFDDGIIVVTELGSDHAQAEMRLGRLRVEISRLGKRFSSLSELAQVVA